MHPGWADTPGVQSALPGFRRITQTVLRSSEEGADTIVWLARAREAAAISGKLFLDREPRTPIFAKAPRNPCARAISYPGYAPLCGTVNRGQQLSGTSQTLVFGIFATGYHTMRPRLNPSHRLLITH